MKLFTNLDVCSDEFTADVDVGAFMFVVVLFLPPAID